MQETSGTVETYDSSYNWHIANAEEWKETAKTKDFRLRTDKMKIENFPMKWRIEVFSDGRADPGLKFKVRMVQNRGTALGVIKTSHYQLKAIIIRGCERVNWLYYDNGRSLVQLETDNCFEQYIGKLSHLKSLLNGQEFYLRVSVKIFQDVLEIKHVEPVNEMCYKLDVLDYVKGLLETKGSSNVTIFFGDNSYKAHKSVLSARSDVFAALFENTPEVKEYDIYGEFNKESIEAFMRFLYTGECEEQSIENAKNLMKLAHNFKVDDLKEIYENMLMAHVKSSSAMGMLQFAIKYGSAYGLKEAAFDTLKKDYKTIDIDIPDELINETNALINFAADAMTGLFSNIQL